jgi:transcriptional regulator with XRE-family HTH domain
MMTEIPSNKAGGRLLASLRQQSGLTQGELAERAQVSRSMVAQLETGERRPSRKMLIMIGAALDLPSEDEHQLLAAYRFLPLGQTQDQIVALLRADKNLTDDQAQRIASIVREAYQRALDE